MANLSKMQGSPWHIDKFTRKPGDKRRHRSKCIHYNRSKEFCSKEVGRCRGAAHCRYYDEEGLPENVSRIPTVEPETEEPRIEFNGYSIPAGSRIRHKKYGDGTVTADSNGIATILFDSGEEKKLQLEVCAKNNIVSLL